MAALLCLALGIGANTAVFTLLNGALLRPLPFRDPERLVFVANAPERSGSGWGPLSYPDIVEWREGQHAAEGMAGYRNVAVTLSEGGTPERLVGMGVTDGLFETLGVQPALGRSFSPEEAGPGGPKVAVLTWGLWQRRFGGDPEIVGRTIDLQGEPHTVLGIMPEGFEFPWWSELYLPLQEDAARYDRNARSLRAVARLGDGVRPTQARSELERVRASLKAEYPESYAGLGVYLNSYQDEERASRRQGLVVLMVGVGLVLLIACVNVANLLLARAAGLGREIAIRTSLGAGRGAIVRQMGSESASLGVLGATGGLALGVAGRDLLLSLAPSPKPFWMDFGVDLRVLGFVAGIGLLTTLIFGLAPIIFTLRAQPSDLLRSGGDRNASGHSRWGRLLVAGEVTLALALLVSAGSMTKGLSSLLHVDPGFDPEGVLTFGLTLSGAEYPTAAERADLFGEALDELEALPSVLSA